MLVYERDLETCTLALVQSFESAANNQRILPDAPQIQLSAPTRISLSPDNNNAYAFEQTNWRIGMFRRGNEKNPLNYVGLIREHGRRFSELVNTRHLIISPDDANIYVTNARPEQSVAVLARNPKSDDLTFVESWHDDSAIPARKNQVDDMESPGGMAIDANGKYLYVASLRNDAITTFARQAHSGKLTPLDTTKTWTAECSLAHPQTLALEPEGRYLYCCNGGDGAMAVFQRDATTGMLSFLQVLHDDHDGIDGLANVCSIKTDGSGNRIFCAAGGDSAISIFDRDPSTGKLKQIGLIKGDVNGIDGLSGVADTLISPDGKYLDATASDATVAVFAISALKPED